MAEQVTQKGVGFTNFNAGSIRVLAGQCLRNAALPTECRICIEGCPARALELTPKSKSPKPNRECIQCGMCIELCPVNTITASRETSDRLAKRLRNAGLNTQNMIVTCERTMGLAKMRSQENSKTGNGAGDYELLNDAKTKGQLQIVPCLSMMGPEVWFAFLNEMSQSDLEHFNVLLPCDQCADCPVNSNNLAEALLVESIEEVELWVDNPIGLIGEIAEIGENRESALLPFIEVFSSEKSVDRRDIFSEAFRSLTKALDASEKALKGEKEDKFTFEEQTLIRRWRQDASKRTLLGERLASKQASNNIFAENLASTQAPQENSASSQTLQTIDYSKSTLLPPKKRRLLVEALGFNARFASFVEQCVSVTDTTTCVGCGNCVKACALKARFVDEATQVASVDILVCIGCSACLEVCPRAAIDLTIISGEAFLAES